MSSVNNFALSLQLSVPKVGGPTQRNLIQPQIELLSFKFGSSKTCWTQKKIYVRPPTFNRLSAKFLSYPLYELPNLELGSSNTCRTQVFCVWPLLKLPTLLQKLGAIYHPKSLWDLKSEIISLYFIDFTLVKVISL
jgi:hypothetical protein